MGYLHHGLELVSPDHPSRNSKMKIFPPSRIALLSLSLTVFAAPILGGSTPVTLAAESTQASQGFLQNNDTIVWIGSGFTERMQQSNWIDLVLTAGNPTLKFRNIGWSGDTVFGDARGVFGGREDGFKRLVGDLDKTSATKALVCYGENECREGEAGLDEFEKGYRRLLKELSDRNIKVALILPRRFETEKVPNAELWNKNLAAYNRRTKSIAAELKLPVIDLENFKTSDKLTTDGIYWSDEGYRQAGFELANQLGLKLPEFWAKVLRETPESGPLASYRDLVRQKNEWFFHFHRPQNETYLFLFRKHEQGNNAAELEQILPTIEKLEGQIKEALGANR